jgi:hypothetical protein
MAAKEPVKLWNSRTCLGKLFDGPVQFKAKCGNCGVPRNRHCGRCRACPGGHMEDCLKSHATGAWH